MNDSINYKGKTYLVSTLLLRQKISIVVFGVLGSISFISLSKGISIWGLITLILAIISILFYIYYSKILKLRKPSSSEMQPHNHAYPPLKPGVIAVPETFTFKLAGTSFVQDTILKYQYAFRPKHATLIPDPQNPHDPNAIGVYVNDERVGYVPKRHCTHVKKILFTYPVSDISVKFHSSSIKDDYDYDDDDDDNDFKNDNDSFDDDNVIVWGKCTISYTSYKPI